MMIEYPKIITGMITLGVVGYSTNAMVRMLGGHLMRRRVRELACYA
jgi:NitT/TauT family transport system permease protein